MELKKITDAEYFSIKDRLSSSEINCFNRASSPKHFKYQWTKEREPSDSMNLGSLFHAMILQPETVERDFIKKPEDMKFSTAHGKIWRDDNAKKIIIDHKDYRKAEAMRDNLKSHPIAASMLQNCMFEMSLLFNTSYMEKPAKSKIDAHNAIDNYIVDIKTTQSAQKDTFMKSILDYGYHIQAAFYLDGISQYYKKSFDYFIIAIETEAPHDLQIFNLSYSVLRQGQDELVNAISNYDLAERNGFSYGYGLDPVIINSLPEWYLKKKVMEAL